MTVMPRIEYAPKLGISPAKARRRKDVISTEWEKSFLDPSHIVRDDTPKRVAWREKSAQSRTASSFLVNKQGAFYDSKDLAPKELHP